MRWGLLWTVNQGFTPQRHYAGVGHSRMSNWQSEKTERNRRSLTRLCKALPTIFPPAVLARALGRPFKPRRRDFAIEFAERKSAAYELLTKTFNWRFFLSLHLRVIGPIARHL